MRHWLFKTEPDAFSWDRLKREGRTEWSGVRSFQARNYMLEMRLGDLGFFYHSSIPLPAIVGIVKVVREGYPDHTAFDQSSEYFDRRASRERPLWQMVDVEPSADMPRPVTLGELRNTHELAYMPLLRKGQRLSVQPVSDDEWKIIMRLSKSPRQ